MTRSGCTWFPNILMTWPRVLSMSGILCLASKAQPRPMTARPLGFTYPLVVMQMPVAVVLQRSALMSSMVCSVLVRDLTSDHAPVLDVAHVRPKGSTIGQWDFCLIERLSFVAHGQMSTHLGPYNL